MMRSPLVPLLTGALLGSLVVHVATATRESQPRPGPCGEQPPDIPRLRSMCPSRDLVSCRLDSGHAGMHKDDALGVVWGRRRVGLDGRRYG